MSMTDDDLNALLAAWAKEDGSGGEEIGSAGSESDTFAALTSGSQGGWQNKSQGGGGGGGWQQSGWQQKQQSDKGGKSYGKSKSASPMRISNGEPVYFGKVKTYDKEKNRGYISCEEICDMVGMDVYVYGDVLSQAGGAPGDSVAFFCHWSQAGQPQASAPMLRLGEADSAGGFALKGEYKAGNGGNGFIVCDVIKEFFGRDVFVRSEFATGLQAGQTIAFNAYLNEQKYPAAERLEPCMPDWEPTLGDLSHTRTDPSVQSRAVPGGCSGNKGKGKGGGGGDGGWNGGKGDGGKGDGGKGGGGKMDQLMSMLGAGDGGGKGKGGKMEMLMGMMGMLMGDGWGDDSWDSWGDDSWGGGWDSGGKGGKGGDSWGSDKGKSSGKGKDKGKEWKPPAGPPTASGETYYGVIKSFNEKNNFGFIASEQIQEKYNGVDCFFHGKILGGHSVGDMVEFDVGLNNKGQPQALYIRPLTLPDGDEPPSKQMKFA